MTLTYLEGLTASELIGVAGAVIYCGAYLAVAVDVISSRAPSYYTANMTAAAMVLIGLTGAFNLAAAMIQLFFLTVSVVGVLRHLGRRKRAALAEAAG